MEKNEAAVVLGEGCAGDCFVGVMDCSTDTTQEIIFVGGCFRLKFFGNFATVSCEDERR